MNFVSILMNSESDIEIMKQCTETFDKFNVKFEMLFASNHKSIDETKQNIKDAEEKGAVAFIVAAGIETHLLETVAALTTKPVIGVPKQGEEMNVTLSTVQMPLGMPVGTVALGNSGAFNVAYFAMQILALSNKELAIKLKEDRIVQSKKVQSDSFEIDVV